MIAKLRDHPRVNTVLPVIVAAFGIAGTLGGVWLTQRRADRREDMTWTREIERRKRLWAREDAAQTFEHRRTAYVDFYQANLQAAQRVSAYIGARLRGDDEADLPPAWASEAEEQLQALEIYAAPRVTELAHEAQTAYRKMAHGAREWQGDRSDDSIKQLQERADEWEVSTHELLDAIRRDLGVLSDLYGSYTTTRRSAPWSQSG
jgi:hypothetical protein